MSKPKFPRWFVHHNGDVIRFASSTSSGRYIAGPIAGTKSGWTIRGMTLMANWRELTEDEAKEMMKKEKGGV